MKRPAFQFYPGDWLRDAHLRICSSGARGCWIDLIAVMHQAKPYGHLVFNGKALDNAQLARMIGETPKDVARWVKELEDNGVASRDENGILYSRRMVRDELLRNARATGGPKGAEHGSKGAEFGALGGRPKQSTEESTRGDINPPSSQSRGVMEPPIKPPPSSSSSSSRDTPSQVSPGGGPPVDNPPGQKAGKAKARKGTRWWDTDQGIVAEGKRRGIDPQMGEAMETFRQRVWNTRMPEEQGS
jgi:hypothetical protein